MLIEPSPGIFIDSREHYNNPSALTANKGRDKMGVKFSQKYKFEENGQRTGVLEQNGKLFTFLDGPNGGMTAHENWEVFVKEVMSDTPAKTEEAALEQLDMVLGSHVTVEVEANVTPKATAKQKQKDQQEESTSKDDKDMATKKAVKKTAAKKDKAPKEMKRCICGASDCKAMTTGNFAPGHDARVHGYGKKIAYGEMKFSEIGAEAAKYLKEHGIKYNTETRPEKSAKKK